MLAIAHHRMLDARRARGRRPADPVPTERFRRLSAGPADASEGALQADALATVRSLVDELGDDQRTVVLLRVVGGLPVVEVARLVERSPGHVRVLCHRALRKLAERYGPEVRTA